ncbi:MAG: peptidyl-prolyl cis-trans isomerase [Roseburia sp.]
MDRGKMIRTTVGVVAGAAVVVGMIFFAGREAETTVMWVGELPVCKSEFEDAMRDEYANTCGYFARIYGAEVNENFWETEFDGVTPMDYIKEKARDRVIEEKLVQSVGLEMGFDTETDYEDRIDRWEAENENREKMVAENQPVYGPVWLGWRQYKADVQGDLIQKIQSAMYEREKFSEEEIAAYYEAHKQSYFKNPSDYKIEYVKVPIWGEGDEKNEELNKRARQIMNDFSKEVEGGSFDALGRAYESTYAKESFTYQEESIGEEAVTKENMLFPTVLRELETMEVGEISGMIEERNACYIVRCMEKTEMTYEGVGETEEAIRRLMTTEAYEQMMAERKRDTEIQMNEEIYKEIQLNMEF